MKKLIYSILGLSLVLSSASCSKDESLDVDLSKYNYDDFEKLPIDDYIYNNLTKPYNVEVIYRFDRSHSDIGKNISPPKIEQVQPAVDMVLDGFIKVYEKVAGPTFIKTYTPKQFVLFGSHAYNSNGSVTLGTADGGRRVVLYDINNIDANNSDNISRRLQTIHHEFTHILNQIVPIPSSFRVVTTDYVPDWTASSNTEAEALKLGFISPYSRSSYPEDFAETVAHLLIKGQVYYNQKIAQSTADGAAKLRLKQSIVEEYFKQNLNMDFKELQFEIQQVLKNQYKDQSQDFTNYFKNNAIKSIGVNMDGGSEYSVFGKSEAFAKVWQAVKTEMPKLSNNAGRQAVSFVMEFVDAGKMQLKCTYKNAAGANLSAFYDFTITHNADKTIDFTFVPSTVTVGEYWNGTVVVGGFKPLIDYLNNNIFTADWISPEMVGTSNLMKYAGFFVKGDPTNYVYGPVTIK